MDISKFTTKGAFELSRTGTGLFDTIDEIHDKKKIEHKVLPIMTW